MSTLHNAASAIRADDVAQFSLTNHGTSSTCNVQIAQTEHRLDILKSWIESCHDAGYDLDSDVIAKCTLDIGCGQGDMTALFAAVLEKQGNSSSRVIGVDPARADYGSPFTLGEAQHHLASGPLATRLSFVKDFAPDFISTNPYSTFSVAMFVHSLYYLPSADVIVQTFKSLREAGMETLLLSEWALSVSRPTALSHLLAVLLQSLNPLPEGNVRTVISPSRFVGLAKQAGWSLVAERIITPRSELDDGRWEVSAARRVAKRQISNHTAVSADAQEIVTGIAESMNAHADALETSIPGGQVTRVTSMDVWTAVFRHSKVH